MVLRDNQTNNNGRNGVYLGFNPFDDSYTIVAEDVTRLPAR